MLREVLELAPRDAPGLLARALLPLRHRAAGATERRGPPQNPLNRFGARLQPERDLAQLLVQHGEADPGQLAVVPLHLKAARAVPLDQSHDLGRAPRRIDLGRLVLDRLFRHGSDSLQRELRRGCPLDRIAHVAVHVHPLGDGADSV